MHSGGALSEQTTDSRGQPRPQEWGWQLQHGECMQMRCVLQRERAAPAPAPPLNLRSFPSWQAATAQLIQTAEPQEKLQFNVSR